MTYRLKKRLIHGLIGVVCIISGALVWDRVTALRHLEELTVDFRYRHFNPGHKASSRVVVIDIDEQSLKLLSPHFGRWPWSRRVYKELIGFIALGEPSLILFDILFTEKTLHTDDDKELALISSETGLVSHAMNLLEERAEELDGKAELPAAFKNKFAVPIEGKEYWPHTVEYRDFALPLSDHLNDLPKIHLVNFGEEHDGVFRRAPLLFQYGELFLPSLSLAGVLSTRKSARITVEPKGQLTITSTDSPPLFVPIDKDGRIPLHFYKIGHDPVSMPVAPIIASARQLQKGAVSDPSELKMNPFDFKDKVVVIGTSAVGLKDLKTTPLRSSYPGVLLQATAISNMLEGHYLKRVSVGLQKAIHFVLLIAVYACVLFLSHMVLKIFLPLVLLALYSAVAFYLFQKFHLWIDLALPMILGSACIVEGIGYAAVTEGRQRKKLESTLCKYLSPVVTQELLASGNDPRAEVGRVEELSVLFSDVRNFTTISESLEPIAVVSLLNEYLERMTNLIFSFSGTLDKFIGDAIMCFWNAPLREDKHALISVRCALAMQEALSALRKEWDDKKRTTFPFYAGIGINTGKVVVGNIGSEKRLDYTVIGDNVNTASRIEGLTKQYQVPILVGENTYQCVKSEIRCRLIDRVQVKGKVQYSNIYEPLGAVDELSTARKAKWLCEPFEEALILYHAGNFDGALKKFLFIDEHTAGEDGATQIFIERCKKLLKSPPIDWKGVYVAHEK